MSEKFIEGENIKIRQLGNMIGREGKHNDVYVCGIIEEEFEYSHETFWEKFFETRIKVARTSGTDDLVKIVVSEVLLRKLGNRLLKGVCVEVKGEFHSYNRWDDNDKRQHLDLFVFARDIQISTDEELRCLNSIYLDGYVSKPPVYRITPFGRQITDLFISVNRSYNKSDYIPCIAWGRKAEYVSTFQVGDRIQLYGRIQSRKYFKKDSLNPEIGTYKDIYEISIFKIKKVEF